jgi:hypothetical protein
MTEIHLLKSDCMEKACRTLGFYARAAASITRGNIQG